MACACGVAWEFTYVEDDSSVAVSLVCRFLFFEFILYNFDPLIIALPLNYTLNLPSKVKTLIYFRN